MENAGTCDYARRVRFLAEEYTALILAQKSEARKQKQAEAEEQDLVHALELYTLSAKQRTLIADALRAARIARREAKDALVVLDRLHHFENRAKAYNAMCALKEDISAVEEQFARRNYNPRSEILHELGVLKEQAETQSSQTPAE